HHELAEDEDLVPTLDGVRDELPDRDELARVIVAELPRQAEQPRVAGRLPEAGEAGEDLQLALRETDALDLAEDLRPHLARDLQVERPLLAREIADLIHLDLLR